MANIGLIKKLLSDKTLKAPIHDIFTEEEMGDYEAAVKQLTSIGGDLNWSMQHL